MSLSLIFLIVKYHNIDLVRLIWELKELVYVQIPSVQDVGPTAGWQADQVSLAPLSGLPVWSNNKTMWLWALSGHWSLWALSSLHCLSYQMNHFIRMKDLQTQYARLGWFIQPICGHREKTLCLQYSYKDWTATICRAFGFSVIYFCICKEEVRKTSLCQQCIKGW